MDLDEYLYKYNYPECSTHWTRFGVFAIQVEMVAGSPAWHLWYEDKDGNETILATYLRPKYASEDLASGKHDKALGFSTSQLNIPSNYRKWNNLE